MTADEHLGWQISGLLDGELGVTEEILARQHLEGCDRCQQEFAEVMAARSLVRDLGDVEPPQGFLDRAVLGGRSRFSPRVGLIGLVGLAAVWILILAIGLGVALPDVTPQVGDFARQHRELVGALADDEPLPARVGDRRLVATDGVSELNAPYVAPTTLEALRRVAVYEGDGGVQLLFADGDRNVSVFQQEGTLDWNELPDTGERTEVGGDQAWTGASASGSERVDVVVVPRGEVVYTVVAETADEARRVAEALPSPQEYSLAQRTRKNLEGLARRLGFGHAEPHEIVTPT